MGSDPADERCDGCGLPIAGGTEGCQALFDLETLRAYDDQRFARHRRMIVDTYCLQHPEAYCASAISLAAHLTGLCIAMDHPDRLVLHAAVQRWLDRRPVLEKPPIPPVRGGALTIADVRATSDPDPHADVVQRWARETWEAYAPLHGIARAWLARILG